MGLLIVDATPQFKSVWRKGETPPEHVVDRAVNDIAAERRHVTSGILDLAAGKDEPDSDVFRAMKARNIKVGASSGPLGPVSGDHLSRAHHFAQAAMEYIHKLQQEEKDKD
jgi:hypothetical protein